ncbi:MAG: YiiX/YebB-like N1pC/P60 family cysteine hydrolase [Pseudomonadota bacterium]
MSGNSGNGDKRLNPEFRILALLVGLISSACVPPPPPPVASPPAIQSGDLVFLDLGCGKLCDAIADVTKRQFRVKGPSLSHVGILSEEEGRWFLYEAWDGVQRTPYEKVSARLRKLPHPEQRRRFGHIRGLSLEDRVRIVGVAKRYLGRPYDEAFLRNNGKYYCSELVADVFSKALPNRRLFSYRPMYFGDPRNPRDRAWKIWKDYFKKRGERVPVGKPGVSPLGIYLSDDVIPIGPDSKK